MLSPKHEEKLSFSGYRTSRLEAINLLPFKKKHNFSSQSSVGTPFSKSVSKLLKAVKCLNIQKLLTLFRKERQQLPTLFALI